MRFRFAVWVILIAFASDAIAQDLPAPYTTDAANAPTTSGPAPAYYHSPPQYGGLLFERSRLLGDWGGLRSELFDNGVTINASTTQFYQGIAAGGITQHFAYSGRQDYYVNVDGERAGMWEGFFLTLHGETRYGNTVNNDTGSLMAVNTGGLFPLPNGTVTALTGVKMTQYVTEDFQIFGGKLNMLDEWYQPYAAGRGVDAFMNLNLAFPAALARTIPYSTLGAGFKVFRNSYPVFTFMAVDTNNTPTSSGFQSFFNNGATMIARVDIPVVFCNLPGHQGFGATYSTGRYYDLAPTSYFNPQFQTGPLQGTVAGSWAAYYAADHALYVDPNNPQRTWGIFKNFGVADNGPSPVRWSVAFGLGGTSPIVSRPQDTFGIGYSWIQYSTPVANLMPLAFPLHYDQALELFYNVAVTPWFRLTPDVQIVLPARDQTLPPASSPIETVLVLGLRAKIDF